MFKRKIKEENEQTVIYAVAEQRDGTRLQTHNNKACSLQNTQEMRSDLNMQVR